MRCAEHNHENCPEPRCHVLALCASSIPLFRDVGNTLSARWRWCRDAGYLPHPNLIHEYPYGTMVAARLVAWMRWRGERRAGCVHPEWQEAFAEVGVEHADDAALAAWWTMDKWTDDMWCMWSAGVYHPLDTIMPHAERIAVLASKCPRSDCVELPGGKRREHAFGHPCDHDGVNWSAVAVILDKMVEFGISLDAVHEWRSQKEIRDLFENLRNRPAQYLLGPRWHYHQALALAFPGHRFEIEWDSDDRRVTIRTDAELAWAVREWAGACAPTTDLVEVVTR